MSTKNTAKKRTPKLDQRLASIMRFADDIADAERHEQDRHEAISCVLAGVKWEDVHVDMIKLILEKLYEVSDDEARTAMAKVANDEHEMVCACCARKRKAVR